MYKKEVSWENFRRQTHRLQGYDYSSDGEYFITIDASDQVCYFGEVVDFKMKYSKIGQTAVDLWNEIPQKFPFVSLDEFIVMPNHIHGILVLNRSDAIHRVGNMNGVGNLNGESFSINAPAPVEKQSGGFAGKKSPMLNPFSIPYIIRAYKAKCTYIINNVLQNEINFKWQARYYDEIVRIDIAKEKIRKYILENPEKWDTDKYNPKNFPKLKSKNFK